jgi:hypothetical protein
MFLKKIKGVSSETPFINGGADGARTRDLRIDSPTF